MSRDCCVAVPLDATGLSAVCDFGIFLNILTIFVKNLHIGMCPHTCQHNCNCTCKHAVVFSNNAGNSVDPDQLACAQTPSYLDLHCLQKR